MHRSFTNLPLLALLGIALACGGCHTQQSERQVDVSPGPVLFSQQAKTPESRLVGPAGSQPPATEKGEGEENAGATPAAQSPEAQTASTQAQPAKAEAPARGATASLSDAPATGANQLSDEERAALTAGFEDAGPEVRELANRLAALEIPEGAAGETEKESPAETAAVAAAGGDAADDEKLPKLDDDQVAQTAGEEKSDGAEVRQAAGDAESEAAAEVRQASASKSEDTPKAGSDEADAKVAAMKTAAPEAGDGDPLAELTDAQIFEHLIGRYRKRSVVDDPDGEVATNDLIALRTLMVLSGNPDGAVAPIEGWKSAEQEFLSYHMLALWQLVDPQAHPVRARRWTTALPELRQATSYLAAATDTLEVRNLAWCTEVVLYDQIKPFPSDRFVAGQDVILYSEIDNFGVERLSDGVETHLQGTYEIIDTATGQAVATLAGEVDRQQHNKAPRDYFLAYIITWPNDLQPGKYKLRLTVEDFKSGKYGRSSIPFEIVAPRSRDNG